MSQGGIQVMAAWGDFAQSAPEMADVFLKLLDWIPMAASCEKLGQPGTNPVRQFWRAA